jgi:arginine decarboxylase
MPTAVPTQEHFNASRLRTHTWDRLKIAVSELATDMPSGGKARNGKKEAIAEVDGLLQQLDVVETYWAYPGREAVRGLRTMLERQEFTALEHRTLKLVRTLVSGQVVLNTGEEHKPDHEGETDERPRSKYFEVLFVDDLNTKEERELKQNLAEVRDPKDPFMYDAIVVPPCRTP